MIKKEQLYIDNKYEDLLQKNIQQLQVECFEVLLINIDQFLKKVDPKNPVAIASNGKISKNKQTNYCIYVGGGGYLFTYLKLFEFFSQNQEQIIQLIDQQKSFDKITAQKLCSSSQYLTMAEISYNKLQENISKDQEFQNISFLMGSIGIKTLGVILYLYQKQEEKVNILIKEIISFSEWVLKNSNNQNIFHELLYGMAGTLYCLLMINKYQKRVDISKLIYKFCDVIIQIGQNNYSKKNINLKKELPRLFYDFHQTEYLGGAHGTMGILCIVIQAILNDFDVFQQNQKRTQEMIEWIKITLDSGMKIQTNKGNFSSTFKMGSDRKVQFCHGSPGIIQTYIYFQKLQQNNQYQNLIEKASNCIWENGILKKGFGICHGISGNGYQFLNLYNQSSIQKYYKQALIFSIIQKDEFLQKIIQSYDFPDRYEVGISDHPMSLMEGLAGVICYNMDCLVPQNAKFPAYEVQQILLIKLIMKTDLGLLITALGLRSMLDFTPKVDKTLKFNQNHEFTILQFTDLHYGDSNDRDQKNMVIQQKIIDIVKPDLAVLTGDMVSGYAWDGKEKDFYYKRWQQFTKCFTDNKLLYAYTLGNHDHQADLDYVQIGQLDRTHPYALFDKNEVDEDDSLTNYTVEIKSSFNQNETTANLWLFDSKDRGCEGYEGDTWGCIGYKQIEWYNQKSIEINKKYSKNVQGLSFFHIPIPEYMNLWNFYETRGLKEEVVSCPKKNTYLFDSFLQNNNMKGVFCGHDHNNDYSGTYQGIELVFGRKTGYGSYGPTGKKGATVIKVKEFLNEKGQSDFTFTYYIVEEDGTIIDDTNNKSWKGYHNFQVECEAQFIINIYQNE